MVAYWVHGNLYAINCPQFVLIIVFMQPLMQYAILWHFIGISLFDKYPFRGFQYTEG